jgi:hypothetical protein
MDGRIVDLRGNNDRGKRNVRLGLRSGVYGRYKSVDRVGLSDRRPPVCGAGTTLGDSLTQVVQTMQARYFDEMGVDRELLDKASLVPSWSMRWLSLQEVKQARLDT